MTLALRIFYRRIYLIGRGNIPKSGPLILAVTHPNAFMDDILVACLSTRSMIFLARGDVFRKKFARILLKSFHIYPIFRPRDGKSEVHKNFGYIEEYQNKLAKGQVVLIHPEGLCVHEKNVRPLRKGMARIAFGAEERFNWDLNVQIVPIGLNYTNAPEPQEDVMVCVGKAIPASRYKDLYHENEAKAYTVLNQEVFDALNDLSIVQVKGTEEVSEFCLKLERESFKGKGFFIYPSKQQFLVEKTISMNLNRIYEEEPESFTILLKGIIRYKRLITELELPLFSIHPIQYNSYWDSLLIRWIGYMIHLPILNLVELKTNRLIKSIEFKASILIGLSVVVFGLLYIALSFMLFWTGGIDAIPILMSLLYMGVKGRNYKRMKSLSDQKSKISRIKKNHPKKWDDLVQLSSEIKKLSLPT